MATFRIRPGLRYQRLFSSSPCPKKPGPKGPSEALIQAIVELKSRNPRFGCPRIARIISRTFGVDIDKNVVYCVLSKHYRPAPGGTGPSWLSFIGHTRDSLWSVVLFRCESIVLRSYWVLVVMDQCTRRLVGVGVHGDPVNSTSLCRTFNVAIHGRGTPRHLSTDHDPLLEAHRWAANLRILEIDEIKTAFCPTAQPRSSATRPIDSSNSKRPRVAAGAEPDRSACARTDDRSARWRALDGSAPDGSASRTREGPCASAIRRAGRHDSGTPLSRTE
jgi:hypothetical protein